MQKAHTHKRKRKNCKEDMDNSGRKFRWISTISCHIPVLYASDKLEREQEAFEKDGSRTAIHLITFNLLIINNLPKTTTRLQRLSRLSHFV